MIIDYEKIKKFKWDIFVGNQRANDSIIGEPYGMLVMWTNGIPQITAYEVDEKTYRDTSYNATVDQLKEFIKKRANENDPSINARYYQKLWDDDETGLEIGCYFTLDRYYYKVCEDGVPLYQTHSLILAILYTEKYLGNMV